ncbi:hypothetical protein BC827DRAFT_1385607 [Russula dissimulans]|nr:hypothetical protein BC827DRAFT_1385607 [Russula dissimulans]
MYATGQEHPEMAASPSRSCSSYTSGITIRVGPDPKHRGKWLIYYYNSHGYLAIPTNTVYQCLDHGWREPEPASLSAISSPVRVPLGRRAESFSALQIKSYKREKEREKCKDRQAFKASKVKDNIELSGVECQTNVVDGQPGLKPKAELVVAKAVLALPNAVETFVKRVLSDWLIASCRAEGWADKGNGGTSGALAVLSCGTL